MPKILHFSLRTSNPTIHLIDTETFEAKLFTEFKTFDQILSNFLSLPLTDVKCVLISFFNGGIYKFIFQVAKLLREYFESIKIPLFFCSWNSIFASSLIFAYVEEFGEKNLEEKMEFILCEEECVTKFCTSKYANFYKIMQIPAISIDSFERDLIDSNQAKTVISFCEMCYQNGICFISDKQKKVHKMAQAKFKEKSKPFTILKNRINTRQATVRKALHLLNVKPDKFDVASDVILQYSVIPKILLNNMKNAPIIDILKRSLISTALHDLVPFQKKIICYQNFYDITFKLFDIDFQKVMEDFSVIESGTSITLNIDEYYIPKLEINEKNVPAINGTMISLTDDKFTVEIIKNEKLVNIGKNSMPLIISFVDGRIQIGEEAAKLKERHPTFIITDLLKLLKTPSKNLKPDPKWGFEMSKNESNDEILLEFDTFKGRRKASPTFLFAFFIQFAIKNVEKISEKMPKTTVIVAKELDDYFRRNLMDSCNAAKLNLHNIQIHEHKIVEIKE